MYFNFEEDASTNGIISQEEIKLVETFIAEQKKKLKITKDGKTLSSFTMYFNFEEDASTNGIISQEEIKLVETFIAEQKKKLDAYIAEKTKDIEKLKTDVGTLSDDLTTLRNDHSTDIESLEQNSAPPIILTATGESIVVEDSAERRVQGLRIFGKSEQNGVPSPDSPIPIVSIGENGESKIFVHSTQLFDASKLRTKSAGGATVTNNGDGRDSPIPIVSIGENGESKIFVHSTQLFDASKLRTKSAGGATVTNNGDGSFTISGSGTLTKGIQISYRIEHEDLFDASKLRTKSAGGATVTNNGDGSFTISGSGTLTKGIQISYRIEHEDFVKLFHAGNVKVTGAMIMVMAALRLVAVVRSQKEYK